MWTDFLLDADETIFDFVRSSFESFQYAMKTFRFEADRDDFYVFKSINDALWREYEKGQIAKTNLMTERFSRFFSYKNWEIDPKEANKLYFGKLCETGYLLPGADIFLKHLKKCGRIHLITNGTAAAQYGRLHSLKLDSFFDGVYISDEVGFAKPDKKFFDAVLRQICVDKKHCVVIGDSLTSDILGAKNAEIVSIWYNPALKNADNIRPDFIACSYRDVLKMIEKNHNGQSPAPIQGDKV